MELIKAIETRRSIGRVSDLQPPREVIEVLLSAAVKAPNHRNNQPWRFFVLTGSAREELGAVMAESLGARLLDMDREKADPIILGERAKPLRAPVIIVVASKHSDDERINPMEDMQACAAAIQNLLLAAHDQGLAAQWRTGGAVSADAVKAHFGLDPHDEIAGFVYVGYPLDGYETMLKPRPRDYVTMTEWRNGGS
jgi:nitroreductase